MKAVILAGGYGTRISEESHLRPKPMIEIGGRPLLWHILKIFSAQGISDFVVCAGYKGYVIKEYFANYFLHMADVTFDVSANTVDIHHRRAESWRVTVVDTGAETMTGGRLKRVRDYIGNETFCLTYGDGLADISLDRLREFHRREGALATVTAVQPASRFGALQIRGNKVESFREKPKEDAAWINGGFFVLEPTAIDYIEGDGTIWERDPLERLAADGQLAAYKHTGFWASVDTLRDKTQLEQIWASGSVPWKMW